MTIRTANTWLALVVACAFIISGLIIVTSRANQTLQSSEADDLVLLLASDKRQFKLDEPILITVSLLNPGSQTVRVNSRLVLNHESAPEFARDLYFDVVGPENYSNIYLFRVNAGESGAGDIVELKSGERYQRTIELTRYHSLHVAGEYKLVAHYQNHTSLDDLDIWQGSLQSEALVIERR